MDLPPRAGAGPESTGIDNREHEALRDDGPQIYAASLSDYNAGILHGAWIAADQTPDELFEAVRSMLNHSPTPGAEEFAIHDFEGFGRYEVREYDSLDWISSVARGTTEHGLAFAAWAEQCFYDQNRLSHFDGVYFGEWQSVEAYAQELLSDLGYEQAIEAAVPEWLQPYVKLDIEGFARDLELSGDIVVEHYAHGVWIFQGLN